MKNLLNDKEIKIEKQFENTIDSNISLNWKIYANNIIDTYLLDSIKIKNNYETYIKKIFNTKILDYFKHFYDIVEFSDKKDDYKDIIKNIEKIFDSVPLIEDPETLEWILNRISMNYYKLLKIILKVTDKATDEPKDKINDTIKKCLNNAKLNNIKDLIKIYTELINSNSYIHSLVTKNIQHNINFGSLIMDFYTFGRFTRKFAHNKNTIEYNNSNINKEYYIPKNIIYYAGSSHTTNMKQFLGDFGWKLVDYKKCDIEDIEKRDNDCIDVDIQNIFTI